MTAVWRYALTVAAACGLSYFGTVAIIRWCIWYGRL